MLVGGGARVGGRLGIVLVILVGLAVFALGWFSQVKLVQGNWDPTPWRGGFATAGAAGPAAGVPAQGLTVHTRRSCHRRALRFHRATIRGYFEGFFLVLHTKSLPNRPFGQIWCEVPSFRG
ncbi:hypothetical protein FRC0082_01674 [Corynebacterium diphtheriae]|nr:hypothetical protein FRC0082_01674 [Corynebacterium diphtheriae]